MTHTRTETYEERAWDLALYATDPAASPEQQQAHHETLEGFLSRTPSQAKARIAATAELLGQAVG